MNMRERIARAHFEDDRARQLEGLASLNGGRSLRSWPQDQRALQRQVAGTKWESLEQRDRDRYLRLADVALDPLTAPPTPSMVAAGAREVAHLQHRDNRAAALTGATKIWEAMTGAMIAEGK